MTQIQQLEQQAYASNVLCQGHHDEFVKQNKAIARDANIPVHVLYLSMLDICDANTVEYIRQMRFHTANNVYGFCFQGPIKTVPVQDRMMRMAAACLRNYISAKVMTVQEVLAELKDDGMPSPTVLFIPNFFFGSSNGAKLPQWQVALLLGLLYQRQKEGLQTVIYVSNMDELAAEFGPPIAAHILENYVMNPA